jgi:hypothetical protein
MTTVYFAGTEDLDFIFEGPITINTSTANFRSQFSRSCLLIGSNASFARSATLFSASNFWFSARVANGFTAGNTSGAVVWRMYDSAGVVRLQMELTAAGNAPTTYKVVKITAAGVKTTLFTGTFIWPAPVAAPNETMKIDVNVNYAVAGSITMYLTINSVLTTAGTFAGDVTTDAATALAQIGVSDCGGGNNNKWSELMVCDVDTRNFSLQTFPPVANGNTHTFDTGTPAAANVNETIMNDATVDGSSVAAQIDEYTQGAVATGSFSVVAVGVSARALKGATGPSKMDFVVRTGAADFLSADVSLNVFFATFQNWWTQNPNTVADWTTAQIGNTAGFNIGLKSIT